MRVSSNGKMFISSSVNWSTGSRASLGHLHKHTHTHTHTALQYQ